MRDSSIKTATREIEPNGSERHARITTRDLDSATIKSQDSFDSVVFESPDVYIPKQLNSWSKAITGKHRERDEKLNQMLEATRQRLVDAEKALIDFQDGIGLSLKEKILYSIPFIGSRLKAEKLDNLTDKAEIAKLFYTSDYSMRQSREARYALDLQNGRSNAEFPYHRGDQHLDPLILKVAIPVAKKETLFSFNTLKDKIGFVQDAGPGNATITEQGDTSITIKNHLNQTLYLERQMDGKVNVYLSNRADGMQRVSLGDAWNDDALKILEGFAQGNPPSSDLLNQHYDRLFIPSLKFYNDTQLAWIPPWLK